MGLKYVREKTALKKKRFPSSRTPEPYTKKQEMNYVAFNFGQVFFEHRSNLTEHSSICSDDVLKPQSLGRKDGDLVVCW